MKKYYSEFIKLMKRKADWDKPKLDEKYSKKGLVKFYLKSGGVLEKNRINKVINYFWKFAKPIKYYMLKWIVITNKSEIEELKENSTIWK